tara:strand:- start:1768 stop:1992 length:225 start_codon:yes stop_codon:yes gene_type:complete
MKQEYVRELFEGKKMYNSTLEFLDKNYPNSKDYIDYIEIIGSGTSSNNCAIGIPRTKVRERVFEIELDLTPGAI